MQFRDRYTGVIYTVTNPALFAQYENDPQRFEKIEEAKADEAVKKPGRRKKA